MFQDEGLGLVKEINKLNCDKTRKTFSLLVLIYFYRESKLKGKCL